MINAITNVFPLFLLQNLYRIRVLFAGMLLPLGFAPFHFPGLAILGISLLFAELRPGKTIKQALWAGFAFGIGFMGIGVSWIYVSIHEYGHLNIFLSAITTATFIAYNGSFFAIMAFLFNYMQTGKPLLSSLLFSATWCLIEYLRATFLTGFPWLLLGFGQIDAPLSNLLPIIGVYGVGFLTTLAACFLVLAIQNKRLGYRNSKQHQLMWLSLFVAILLLPNCLNSVEWSKPEQKPLSVSVIQSNLSMRDKWDETLFWQLLNYYKKHLDDLIGKKQLIIMPESAIPIPSHYVGDFITDVHIRAKQQGSTVLFGIPKAASEDETEFYNTLMSIGVGKGSHIKQHLVPFGEYIPKPLANLLKWATLPLANIKSGESNQTLVTAQRYPIATLICYELAYPELLRKQLPKANWIVSISDDGWFGHSLAMYQQLQIAQALSKLSARYQIVANNDGLSSIIDPQGHIIQSLPSFSSGVLNGTIYPTYGQSPWILFGDQPILFLSLFITSIAFFKKRRYPNQPSQF